MISALKERDLSKFSYARVIGLAIIAPWILGATIAAINGKPLPAFPPVAAALALMFYFSNMIGGKLMQAVIKRLLGIRDDKPVT